MPGLASRHQGSSTGHITGRRTSQSPSWAPSRPPRGGRTRTGSPRTTWATPAAGTTPASTSSLTTARGQTGRTTWTPTWRGSTRSGRSGSAAGQWILTVGALFSIWDIFADMTSETGMTPRAATDWPGDELSQVISVFKNPLIIHTCHSQRLN